MALDAHSKERHHLVALYAGTALEHLAKACLASHSPVLLAEFRNESSSYKSVLYLLDVDAVRGTYGGRHADATSAASQLRTVGLSGALDRMQTFIGPVSYQEDLRRLTDMRNGSVHAAADVEVAMSIMVAFVPHVEALLGDLRRERRKFWGSWLKVADAITTRARDNLTHSVQVKLAAARATFRQYREPLVIQALQQVAEAQPLGPAEAYAECPACGSQGVSAIRVTESVKPREPGEATETSTEGSLVAESFACRICGLRLNSADEVATAGVRILSQADTQAHGIQQIST
jgi:hypothetical protein